MTVNTALDGNAVATVADVVKRHYRPELMALPGYGSAANVDVLLLPEGIRPHSVKPMLDEYRTEPERRKGTARLQDLRSFIAHVCRFKDADSALFAQRNMEQPALTAVLNYHRAGDTMAQPRFGDHRAHYQFPLSEEWQTWMGRNGKVLDQTEFAAFIEDNIDDVLPPPDLANAPLDDAWAQEMGRMLALIGGSAADPMRLAELSRGISIRSDDRAEQKIDLASGQKTLVFKSEHVDDQGQAMKVPSLFFLGIPVFDGGVAYTLAVKLRYRLAGGAVRWAYELHRPDKVFRHAFDQATQQAAAETGLPLFLGTPE